MTTRTVQATGFQWVLEKVGAPLRRVETELPTPPPGRALVRVVGCGVCHTDVGFLFDGVKPRAGLPLALGHEIAGEVIAAGAGSEDLVGRAVIVPAVTPCGECEACRAGHGAICPRQEMPGNDIPGGFASHVLVPARGLCPVDDPAALAGGVIGKSGCTLAELAVVADAVTTPFQAMRRAEVGSGDFVVVVGLGGVGGYAAQIAHAYGATVVGFDVDPQRLTQMESHGLTRGFDPSESDPRELRRTVRALAKEHGQGPQRWRIFECSGTAAGQQLAWSLLGPGAYLSIVGYTLDKVELRLSNLMAFDAVAAGNWGCLPELYPEALQLALDGRIAIAPFVQMRPMSDVWGAVNEVREHRAPARLVLVP